MDEPGSMDHKEDVFSKAVRAGKRTYFFDVKSTRTNELYLTITESKKRFNQQNGRFFYEKHKLFLYREDFDKFIDALKESFQAVDELQGEIIRPEVREGEAYGASYGGRNENAAAEEPDDAAEGDEN
jgi:hypothetical protein